MTAHPASPSPGPVVTGMRTVLAVERDRWAAATYRLNMPGVTVLEQDIRYSLGVLAEGLHDVILGGPPCQPFSHSGAREGSADERDCIPHFVEAVRRVRPRMFLMENVPGLLTWQGGRYAAEVRQSLERLGYVVDVRTLDAVYYGVPQFRERVWFWGIRADVHRAGARHEWPAPTHRAPSSQAGFFDADELPVWVTVGEALGLTDGARVAGAGTNPHFPGDVRTERDLTDEPCTCIPAAAGEGSNALPRILHVVQDARGLAKKQNGAGIREDSPSYTIDTLGTVGVEEIPRTVSAKHPACDVDRPAVTVSTAGDGHSARETLVRIPGASGWSGQRVLATAAPSPTIPSKSNPELVEYRWSDEMRANASPASVDEPSPAVMAKWHKGGAEGLLAVEGVIVSPCDTITVGHRESLTHAKRQGYYRRLTPDECLRLQSAPVDWVWPAGITKTARYRIAGNGWACLMAWHLRRALERADPQSQTVLDLFAGGGLAAVGWHGRFWSRDEVHP